MRSPGYEYLDRTGTGRPDETLSRETMATRRAADAAGNWHGRPRGVAGHGPDTATRQMHADWRDELAKMKARLEQLG